MPGGRARIDRRTLLRGIGAAALLTPAALALPACSSSFAAVGQLHIGTGGDSGEYHRLGGGLARAWQQHLGLGVEPQVLTTDGSVDNLHLLTNRTADIVFSQMDAATDTFLQLPRESPDAPCALGRVYDEFVQVVVPKDSPATSLAGLTGARVSIGAPKSGVTFVAQRLLATAGVGELQVSTLGIDDSIDALGRGDIDAFFWTGGIPTETISALAERVPIRVLDLAGVIEDVRRDYPVYAPATVPATTYGMPEAITTLLVRNALLVANRMPFELARSLAETVFTTQEEVARTNPLALRTDLRAAIGTQPVPLHPGAEAYFRQAKNS